MSHTTFHVTSNPPSTDHMSDVIYISNAVLIFQWITYSIVCQAIVVFGTGANIINFICFVRQGFNDPVNVSLVGLTIADLGCLLTLVWTNICMNPTFMAADLPFLSLEVQHLTTGMPHVTFTNVTSWMTAVITLERCLCVTAPLQVKNIVTSKRMSIVIICLFVVLLSSLTPVYFVDKLDVKWIPERNRSLVGLVRIPNREEVDRISSAIINGFIPFSSFVVVSICTVTLVVQLHIKSKWRERSTAALQADSISNRNQKVSKMVVMISTLFIICFIPIRVYFVALSMLPDFSVYGKYRPYLIVIGGLGIVLESLNSSVNIFFYYHMSYKYRVTFNNLCCVDNKK